MKNHFLSVMFLLAGIVPGHLFGFGKPELLGEPVGTTIIQGVAFGPDGGGRNQLFFATNGSPATFYAVDTVTMEVVFSAPLPGLDVVWAIARGSDGRIYFAGTRGGRLFRYLPEEKKIEDLGHNGTEDNWVWDLKASADGKIYGGTYPGARVFEYDIETGLLGDWAGAFTDQNYVRGLAVSDEAVFAGIGMKRALLRLDRGSGEVRELVFPSSGEAGAVAGVWSYGGRVFVRTGRTKMVVLNEESGELVFGGEGDDLAVDYAISPPEPETGERIYFKRGSALVSYRISEDKVERVELGQPLPPGPVRGWDWVERRFGGGEKRMVLNGLTEFGEMIEFDPEAGSVEIRQLSVEPQGVLIQALEAGPDGRLYLGGYQAGMSVYDPVSAEVVERYPQFNQPEGIGFFEGNVYFGTYGSARIFRLDPERPREFGQAARFNPGLVFSVGNHQDRPFALAGGEGRFFIGTIPDYGRLGGALTVFDGEKKEWKAFPDLIENQSIIGIAVRDGKVYGSTSVFGGLGIKPVEAAAKLFVWDVEEERVLREWVPEIPGIDERPMAIGGLSFGPDGKLWGAAYGTIFVLNPETFEVERSRMIHPSDWNRTHYWRPVYLRWGPDGKLYTTLGWRLTVIDPETLDYEIGPATSLMTLHGGFIYYASGSRLFRLPMRSGAE